MVKTKPNLENLPKSCTTWGFDLTDFSHSDSPKQFQAFLKENNLTFLTTLTRAGFSNPADTNNYYMWHNKDKSIRLLTYNNPITGEYSQPQYRSKEIGYASYMALKTKTQDQLKQVIPSLFKHAAEFKEQNRCELPYIGFPKKKEIVASKTEPLTLS